MKYMVREKMTVDRGFTLLELMVVVSIIAVLMAAVIPSINRYRLRADVSNILRATTASATAMKEYHEMHGSFDDLPSTIPVDGVTGEILHPAFEGVFLPKLDCDWLIVITDSHHSTIEWTFNNPAGNPVPDKSGVQHVLLKDGFYHNATVMQTTKSGLTTDHHTLSYLGISTGASPPGGTF